jgi:DNA-binding NarL/FixJ family response regulator
MRAICDLLDRPVILVDMTNGQDALAAAEQGDCALLVTTIELDDDIRGYQLAIKVSLASPDTRIIVLAESTDPELDMEELGDESPFIYFHRPVDLNQFVNVIQVALDGGDMLAAMNKAPAAAAPAETRDLGPVPLVDTEAARPIIDALLTDVGAMAIVLTNRSGEVLLERGAVGYLDREKLTEVLQPMFNTMINMEELVGGQTRAMHLYDGDDYDVYVLSIGLHHFLCLAFNGETGNRALGSVNRYGRRACEDLVALIGAQAFIVEAPKKAQAEAPRRQRKAQAADEPEPVFEPLERAEISYDEPEPVQLEPIQNLDMSIFDGLEDLNLEDVDDLFDPDKLADLASDIGQKGGVIDREQAEELGILPKLD